MDSNLSTLRKLGVRKCTIIKKGVTGACPSSWFHHGSRCFYISSIGVAFSEAQTICEAMDANLVGILNDVDNTFLSNLSIANMWIGLTRGTHSTWEWSDGSPLTFTRWSSVDDEKSNRSGCVYMDHNGKWVQPTKCDIPLGYVCGYEQSGEHDSPTTVTEKSNPSTITETPNHSTITETPHPSTKTETPNPPTITETPHPSTKTETPHPSTITETPNPPTITETPNTSTITETPNTSTITETLNLTIKMNKTTQASASVTISNIISATLTTASPVTNTTSFTTSLSSTNHGTTSRVDLVTSAGNEQISTRAGSHANNTGSTNRHHDNTVTSSIGHNNTSGTHNKDTTGNHDEPNTSTGSHSNTNTTSTTLMKETYIRAKKRIYQPEESKSGPIIGGLGVVLLTGVLIVLCLADSTVYYQNFKTMYRNIQKRNCCRERTKRVRTNSESVSLSLAEISNSC
ncbi:unnamed protein product [Owenia fusiformis]|uniref:C-type lectin domain-containing protein n=1 Tax=Owenia fusiformis TaxID=6347 RepID=A0A8S4NBE4_OWEFU|nr:unnamed protein product [Owenia fusiformis]